MLQLGTARVNFYRFGQKRKINLPLFFNKWFLL